MSSPAGPDRSDEHERLPCGASTDDLLTQVAEGRGADRDAHQRDCVHCQAALGEFTRSWGPMRELADLPVHAPPDLLARTLSGLRTRAVPDGRGRVDDEGETFQVAARAVITVAGHVAHTTEGVRVALSGLGALTRGPAVAGDAARVGISGQSVAIELTVAADYGQDLHALALAVDIDNSSRTRPRGRAVQHAAFVKQLLRPSGARSTDPPPLFLRKKYSDLPSCSPTYPEHDR